MQSTNLLGQSRVRRLKEQLNKQEREALVFIRDKLQLQIDVDDIDIFVLLKDGIVLCQFLNSIYPDCITYISYQKSSHNNVVSCILAFKRLAEPKKPKPIIASIQNNIRVNIESNHPPEFIKGSTTNYINLNPNPVHLPLKNNLNQAKLRLTVHNVASAPNSNTKNTQTNFITKKDLFEDTREEIQQNQSNEFQRNGLSKDTTTLSLEKLNTSESNSNDSTSSTPSKCQKEVNHNLALVKERVSHFNKIINKEIEISDRSQSLGDENDGMRLDIKNNRKSMVIDGKYSKLKEKLNQEPVLKRPISSGASFEDIRRSFELRSLSNSTSNSIEYGNQLTHKNINANPTTSLGLESYISSVKSASLQNESYLDHDNIPQKMIKSKTENESPKTVHLFESPKLNGKLLIDQNDSNDSALGIEYTSESNKPNRNKNQLNQTSTSNQLSRSASPLRINKNILYKLKHQGSNLEPMRLILSDAPDLKHSTDSSVSSTLKSNDPRITLDCQSITSSYPDEDSHNQVVEDKELSIKKSTGKGVLRLNNIDWISESTSTSPFMESLDLDPPFEPISSRPKSNVLPIPRHGRKISESPKQSPKFAQESILRRNSIDESIRIKNKKNRMSVYVNGADNFVSQYQLGDCIGKGQFGTVYKALNMVNGKVVAVKRIKLADRSDEEIEELSKEVDLLKSLSHPRIVKYESSVKCDHYLNIVLEYVENGSLLNQLKSYGEFPEPLVATYTAQILEGLVYLHNKNVVHCDLKAANILTTKNGRVKLTDFGVSLNLKTLEDDLTVAGTPYWMAPEVIQVKGASTASDIWSLACTIVEMITGKPPYSKQYPMSAMFNIVEDKEKPIPKGLSKSLYHFLDCCFCKIPTDRPTALELLNFDWILESRLVKHLPNNIDTTPTASFLSPPTSGDNSFEKSHLLSTPSPPAHHQIIKNSKEHQLVECNFEKKVQCYTCKKSTKEAAFCVKCRVICHLHCKPVVECKEVDPKILDENIKRVKKAKASQLKKKTSGQKGDCRIS